MDLPATGHRQLTELLDRFGQFVIRHLVAQECDQLLQRRSCFAFWYDTETIPFAKARVRHADHCRVHDARMGVKDLFHLTREELLAAAIDDFLAAAGNLHVAIGIDDAAEIAGASGLL